MNKRVLKFLKSAFAHETIRQAVKLMLILLCIMTLTGFSGFIEPWGWGFDLTSHFRLQYLITQSLFAGLFIVIRRPFWFATMVLFASINLFQILPFYVQEGERSSEVHKVQIWGEPIQLLHMNVFRFNQEHQRVLDYIEKTHPDFLSMAEFDENWIQATQNSPVLKAFPYHQTDAKSRLALFSRYPLTALDLIPVKNVMEKTQESKGQDALIVASFKIKDQSVALILMHPKPPVFPALIQRQQAHFEQLKTLIPTLPRHQIVLGDFNMTSWSHSFKTLTHDMKFQDTRKGLGLQPSWPTHSPLMMIPIDHCLVTEGFITLSRNTGASVGSDHLPIHITLALNKV